MELLLVVILAALAAVGWWRRSVAATERDEAYEKLERLSADYDEQCYLLAQGTEINEQLIRKARDHLASERGDDFSEG